MNPLPFFPPPSRALSRLNDKPPPSSGLTKSNSHHGNRTFAGMTKSSSSRNGTGSSHGTQASSEGTSGQQTPPSSSTSEGEEPGSRKGMSMSPASHADDSRSPLMGDLSKLELPSPKSQPTRKPTSSGTATPVTTGGRLGTRLPQGMFFDLVRQGEVSAAYKMEVKGYPQEDAASLDSLKYRQREAPHLFLGAFVPSAPPKVSGPLSMAGHAQRKLIAYACGTGASALTARSMKVHSDDEDTWLVCLHSVCVLPEHQKKGVALKLIEEYMKRLKKGEQGKGGTIQPKKGYECVALLAHEELTPLYEKAGFKMLGVSHVNWGTGGWFEMRRYIDPKEVDDQSSESSIKPMPSSTSLTNYISPSLAATSSSISELAPAAAKNSDSYFGDKDGMTASPDRNQPKALPDVDADTSTETTTAVETEIGKVERSTEGKAEREKEITDGSQINKVEAAPFTTAQVLEALKKQQHSPTNRSDGDSRNPGIAYSTIMGQTLAAKTTVEDAFFALEARLVDRESNTNLAEIYCPRPECACLLLRAKEADWEIAELGPLASANLSLPNSPAPPSAPVPPPPTSLNRIRSVLGSKRTSTPVRAFWCVYSPMAFDNVGFSKDDDWIPPLLSPPLESANEKSKGQVPERKKPTKRQSLFRGASEWLREGKEKQAQAQRERDRKKEEEEGSMPSPLSTGTATTSSFSISSDPTSPITDPVKVKYLLCADCDCGPLGYTVLPASLQGGKFAQEVGKSMGIQSSSQDQASSEETKESQQEPPMYLIAADRVRYRFVKS